MKTAILREVRHRFSAAFCDRIDLNLFFHGLSAREQQLIALNLLDRLRAQLIQNENPLRLTWEPRIVDEIATVYRDRTAWELYSMNYRRMGAAGLLATGLLQLSRTPLGGIGLRSQEPVRGSVRSQTRSSRAAIAKTTLATSHRHRCHRSQSGYEQRRTPTRAFPSLSRRAPRFLLARASLLGAAGSGPVMSHRAGTPDRS